MKTHRILSIILLFATLTALAGIRLTMYPAIRESANNVLKAPDLVSPAPQSLIYDTACTLIWHQTRGALCYEAALSNNENFENQTLIQTKDTALTVSLTPFKAGAVYWKVRTWGGKKSVSAWSTHSFFLTGVKAVPPPRGCNGNCGNCSSPCGRRPAYNGN